jgi:hypothetical protein
MCATLLGLGAPSLLHLESHLPDHTSAIILAADGFVASVLAIALLLVQRSLEIARIAFGFLLFLALIHVEIPIWTTVTHTVPPTPKGASLLYGVLHAVPCFVAIITRRDGTQNA